MPPRRDFPQGRVRIPRRATSWVDGVGGTAVTDIAASSVQFLGNALVGVVEGLTVVRIRGLFRCWLTLATAANDGFSGAVGIGIAATTAVAQSIGAVPTPITEMDSDNWLWYQTFSVFNPVVSSTELTAPVMAFTAEIDSKAMRKFPTNMSLYAAFEVVEVGTATMSMSLDSRVLVKLS